MKRLSYSERDYAFGQAILTLRTAIGLTQVGLAEILGISRRAVGEWEAGSSYPKAKHLKQLIEIGVKQQTFPVGQEAEEIRLLWKAAHQKILLDEQWLSALLEDQRHSAWEQAPPLQYPPPPVEETREEKDSAQQPATPSAPGVRVDWGDALTVPTFYGREQERTQLVQWIVQEHCRVVSVLGMGGIGKSALAITLMHQVANSEGKPRPYEVVIFRSLRDSPSCEALLDDCLPVLSSQPLSTVPASLEYRISLLLELLRKVHAFIVLDNLEGLLEEGDIRGRFRPGFEGYQVLLRRVAETAHQSCVLLTSREKIAELRALEGAQSPVRSLRVSGLDLAACKQIFAEKGATGTPQDQERLAEVYAGNPLALKIVVETITELFAGDIGQFLSEGIVIFGSISNLLDEQFARLSALEQAVLRWLAIAREPVTIDELLAILVVPLPRVQVLEAIDSLRRRSLIEQGQFHASITLQAVVLEYMTALLIEEAINEIRQQRLDHLLKYGLVQARAKEYVRQTQHRLIVAPILAHLGSTYYRRGAMEVQFLSLLDQLRKQTDSVQGYGPANVIALLQELRGHLRGVDLSHLAIRGAYFQGVEMQDASLVGAKLRDTIFTEAFDATWAVAISHTGQYWAAGSGQGEVRVWRVGGQRLHLSWQAHTDNTYVLAFSPDERTLATGSWDRTVKLWDLQSGDLLWTGRHTNSINCVAFTPDRHLLASGGDDAVVRLWEVATGNLVQTLASQGGALYTLAGSPNGCLLAAGCLDGSIRLWQVQGPQPATCFKVLSGHTDWVLALAFSPDGTRLVSGSCDNTTKLWEVSSGHVLQTLTGHTDRVRSVAWSPDGRTVASAGFDATIWLWDVERGTYRAALHGHTAPVYGITFTPDGRKLLSGSEDGTQRVWDVDSGLCVRLMQGHAVSFYDIDWSPTGTQIVSAGTDLLVTLWSVSSGIPSKGLPGHRWIVHGVAWSPDGRRLASSGWDNAIRLWNPTTGACLQVLRNPDHGDTLFNNLAWSPDGSLLACGSYMRGVQVWDMSTCTRRWVGYPPPTKIRCVAWSPDGSRLASGGDDGSICLWRAGDGELLERWQKHHGGVMSIAWSPDGSRLASGGGGKGDGELWVWKVGEVGEGELVQRLSGWGGSIFAVVWSADGEVLVSGGSDGSLRWWEVGSGKCVRMREGHSGAVQALKVSPDGKTLASCGDDSSIRLWGMGGGERVRTLRRDRPYERLQITGVQGLTEAQKATMCALGALDEVTTERCILDWRD
jgi:WD40 repeat protein/transcriptional regulator with XRE-family HTH domain